MRRPSERIVDDRDDDLADLIRSTRPSGLVPDGLDERARAELSMLLHLDAGPAPRRPTQSGSGTLSKRRRHRVWLAGTVTAALCAAVAAIVFVATSVTDRDPRPAVSQNPAPSAVEKSTPTGNAPTGSATTSVLPVGPAVDDARLVGGGHGYAVTDQGLRLTSDSGRHWITADLAFAPHDIDAIDGISDGTTWVGSGDVNNLTVTRFDAAGHASAIARIHPSNPGSYESSPAPGRVNLSLSFVDRTHGWAATGSAHGLGAIGAAEIFSTVDGGVTWRQRAAPGDGPSDGGLRFVSDQVGFAENASQDLLYRTGDGGRTWAKIELPSPAGSSAYPYQFDLPAPTGVTAELGMIVALGDPPGDTLGSAIYRSEDEGKTWAGTVIGASAKTDDAVGAVGTELWIFAGTALSASETLARTVLFISVDHGTTWRVDHDPGLAVIGAITVDELGRAWVIAAVGDPSCPPASKETSTCNPQLMDYLYESVDDGATWRGVDVSQ